jgi:membrane protein implicated in regulation of membrane protease activity
MLPIPGLPLFWVLDFSVAMPVYLGILALSSVIMLLTVHSVRQPPRSGMEGMRGGLAEIVEAIHSRGRVRYHNALWYASAREPLDVGETVRIVGSKGLGLLVERVSQEVDAPAEATPDEGSQQRHEHRR